MPIVHFRVFVSRRLLHTANRGTQSIRKENDIHTAEYYFENGLRKVKPYNFHFRAYAKERMFGSTVLDVFMTEYRGRSENYYRYAINKGLITVNHEKQHQTPSSNDRISSVIWCIDMSRQ
ncbi:unnamed protein product [Mucor fragilis]